ncbi:hypothetical protein LUW74_43370 [Actinomadura madurae]|uniref:hypothetical protein n=1 Tax=Actinomadura madurae TaxID=1993 RepID=UPI0020274959|nr:hypothetical protein [Actinomadura madurae]URN09522.1 hypothetical protein LUW74_43370 [Actinomadura madurae]
MQKTHLYGPGTVLGAFIDLTAGDGPFAEAIALCLAQGVTQRRTERADAAMLTLAARGDLPADRLGRQLGRLARAGEVRPGRVADALERAVEGGAYAGVWRILAAALPVLCPEPGERPAHRLDRLIALGLRTARWTGALRRGPGDRRAGRAQGVVEHRPRGPRPGRVPHGLRARSDGSVFAPHRTTTTRSPGAGR